MLAGNLIILQQGYTMSQPMGSFLNNGDENKGKKSKDSLRFVCKTNKPNENIVFSLSSDHSKMNVKLENSTNEGQFFEGNFSIEDLPDAFQYFDTVSHVLQDMRPKIQRKEATLQLTSQSEDFQMLKVRMRMYKQMLSLNLHLQKKFASEIAKQTRNLKLLLRQQKQQEQKLKNVQQRQKELDNQKALLQKQMSMIKKQKVSLLQNVNKQLKQQLQEEAKERTIMNQVMIKREQIMEFYCKLVQKGYQFNQKQSDLRKKLIGASAEKKGKKRLYQESSSQGSSLLQNIAKVIKPKQKIKDAKAVHSRHHPPKQQTINQIIVINSETENLNELADDIQEIDLKDQINHAEFQQANASMHRLPLNGIGSSKQQAQAQQIPADPIQPPEEKLPQIANDQPIEDNKGESVQLPKEQNVIRPRRHGGVVVLSSQQIEFADRMEKQFGRKVKVDFSASQNFNKYQCQYLQGCLQIQKTFDDKLIYHIYHKEPIRDFQNMQFIISRLQKRDLTFGIIRKESLKASRLSWSPKSSICWVGCSAIIFPDSNTKVEQLSQSVNVIVSVDTTNKVIKFQVGENTIQERNVPDQIIRQCYFFIQTSTKGNKISFKN